MVFFDLLTQRNTGNGNRFPNDIMTVVSASWNFGSYGRSADRRPPALPRGTAGFQYREKLRVRKYVHLLIYKSFCYEEKENNSKDAAGLLQG